MFPNYVKEIFLDSDTKVSCISGSYSEDREVRLPHQRPEARRARQGEQGSRHAPHVLARHLHAGRPDNWLAKVEEEDARLKPDAWKGYTIGDNTNKHLSKHPWRLDDEKLMYPFYERLVKWSKQYPDRPGLKNVCVHKGLFPPSVEKQFPHLVGYCHVADVGKAAKDWPDLNFVIYHSAYRWVGGVRAGGRPRAVGAHRPRRVGQRPRRHPGAVRREERLRRPRARSSPGPPPPSRACAAFIMGSLVKGLGADHVVWGTDSLWTGAPQWQIEALRRLEIPEDMQKKYGFAPLGPADGPVKNGIFGLNSARLYGYTPKQQAAVLTDRFADCKAIYDKHGGDRTNLAYGYIRKRA